MRKIILAILCLVLVAGCAQKTQRMNVQIVKISGTLPQLMRSSGAVFGNESVRVGNASLILTVKADGGHIYTLEILDGYTVSKDALLSRICVGSKGSFTAALVDKSNEEEALDPSYYTGRESADDFIVPEPCLQQN